MCRWPEPLSPRFWPAAPAFAHPSSPSDLYPIECACPSPLLEPLSPRFLHSAPAFAHPPSPSDLYPIERARPSPLARTTLPRFLHSAPAFAHRPSTSQLANFQVRPRSIGRLDLVSRPLLRPLRPTLPMPSPAALASMSGSDLYPIECARPSLMLEPLSPEILALGSGLCAPTVSFRLVPDRTRSSFATGQNHSPRDSCTRLRLSRTHRLLPTCTRSNALGPSPLARTTLPEILACSSGLRAPVVSFRLGLCAASFSAQVRQRSMGRLDLRHRDGLSPTHCPTPARQRKPVSSFVPFDPLLVCASNASFPVGRSCETFGALSTLRDRYAAQASTRPRPPRRSSGGDLVVCRYLVHDPMIEVSDRAPDGRRPSRAADRQRAGREWFEHRATNARLSVSPSGTSDRHSARSRIALFRLGFRLRGVQP